MTLLLLALKLNFVSNFKDGDVFLWKFDKESSEFEKESLKKYSGQVWRTNWSLTGNMLSVSYANSDGNQLTEVFAVFISSTQFRKMNLGPLNQLPKFKILLRIRIINSFSDLTFIKLFQWLHSKTFKF